MVLVGMTYATEIVIPAFQIFFGGNCLASATCWPVTVSAAADVWGTARSDCPARVSKRLFKQSDFLGCTLPRNSRLKLANRLSVGEWLSPDGHLIEAASDVEGSAKVSSSVSQATLCFLANEINRSARRDRGCGRIACRRAK